MSEKILKDAYILDAARTPFGKRNGFLSTVHPVDLLGNLLKDMMKRSGIMPEFIDNAPKPDIVGEADPLIVDIVVEKFQLSVLY